MIGSIALYTAAISTMKNPLLEVIVAGVIYPLVSHGLKELCWEFVSEEGSKRESQTAHSNGNSQDDFAPPLR